MDLKADKKQIKQITDHYNFLCSNIDMKKARFNIMAKATTAKQIGNEIQYKNDTKQIFIRNLGELINFYTDQEKNKIRRNYYISVNTFFIPKRKNRHLHKLNCLFVDIDNHNTEIARHDIDMLYFYLKNQFFGCKVPQPSMVVSTGRGLQLYWKLKPLSYNPQNIRYWNKMERKLIKAFDEFCFDGFEVDKAVKDAARILRLAGTYNTKAQEYATILECNDNQYMLTEINHEYFLPANYTKPTYKSPKKKNHFRTLKKEKSESYSKQAEASLLAHRLNDLLLLVEMRNGNFQGKRQALIWQVRNILSQLNYTEQEKRDLLYHINKKFYEPLPTSEIEHDLSRETIYNKLTNKCLIDLFEITPAEQQRLKTIIDYKEKQARIDKVRVSMTQERRAEKEKIFIKVRKLCEEGNSQQQIATALGCSVRTIKNYYKQFGISKKIKSSKDNVLALKHRGFTQQQTAEQLGISIRTVRTYWNAQ